MFNWFWNKEKTITCFVCEKICADDPAEISYEAIDDDGERKTFHKPICDECELMMEKFNEYYETVDAEEDEAADPTGTAAEARAIARSVRLRKKHSGD